MDKLAEREMSTFYQQVVNKEMHRSIEKSTEKYFNYESYRPTKSKHDIESIKLLIQFILALSPILLCKKYQKAQIKNHKKIRINFFLPWTSKEKLRAMSCWTMILILKMIKVIAVKSMKSMMHNWSNRRSTSKMKKTIFKSKESKLRLIILQNLHLSWTGVRTTVK